MVRRRGLKEEGGISTGSRSVERRSRGLHVGFGPAPVLTVMQNKPRALPAATTHSNEQRRPTWRSLVRSILNRDSEPVPLAAFYAVLDGSPGTRVNRHWKARVRATLETNAEFVRVGPGLWALASRYSEDELAVMNRARHERYPVRAKQDLA